MAGGGFDHGHARTGRGVGAPVLGTHRKYHNLVRWLARLIARWLACWLARLLARWLARWLSRWIA
eukprot:8364407-Lingulodinium_polyedra.AAC.1